MKKYEQQQESLQTMYNSQKQRLEELISFYRDDPKLEKLLKILEDRNLEEFEDVSEDPQNEANDDESQIPSKPIALR